MSAPMPIATTIVTAHPTATYREPPVATIASAATEERCKEHNRKQKFYPNFAYIKLITLRLSKKNLKYIYYINFKAALWLKL